MNSIVTVNAFSSIYIDKLFRTLSSTQDYEPFIQDRFHYEENYAKGRTGITISSDFKLDPQKDDLYNSVQVYEALKNMNETQASDERIWTYFTLNICWEYMRSRWPAQDAESPINRIRDRYFMRNMNLRTLSRNGVSRLWWYAHLTYDEDRTNKYELTEVLLCSADLTVGITERALGSNRNIRFGILEFLRDNPDIKNSPKKYMELLKSLQLVGGVKNLPFLQPNEIYSLLERVA